MISGRGGTISPDANCSPCRSDAILSGDLDCSGLADDSPAIVLGKRGHLDLAGFSITGPSLSRGVVRCEHPCEIVGPGFIIGGRWGVLASGVGTAGSVRSTHADITGVTFQDQLLEAVDGRRVTMSDSQIVNAGRSAILASKLRVDSVTISDCCDTVQPGGGVLHGPAIRALKAVRSANCTIVGNASGGITSYRRIRDTGSTITGNQTDATFCAGPYPDSIECADIVSLKAPKLSGTNCGTSTVYEFEGPPETWDQCAND